MKVSLRKFGESDSYFEGEVRVIHTREVIVDWIGKDIRDEALIVTTQKVCKVDQDGDTLFLGGEEEQGGKQE